MRSLIDVLADLLLKWKYASTPSDQAEEQRRQMILDLPTQEAKRKADALLADSAKFRVVQENPSTEDSARIAPLGANLREFFSKYRKVEVIYGDARLDRDAIGPSSVNPGFIKIGDDVEFTEIVTKPGDDRVHEFGAGEPDEGDETPPFPTIYHWIVDLAHVIYENGVRGS